MADILIDQPLEGVRRITLNRPERLNAFTFDMYVEYQEALRALKHDSSVRVVILTLAAVAARGGHHPALRRAARAASISCRA